MSDLVNLADLQGGTIENNRGLLSAVTAWRIKEVGEKRKKTSLPS
jgi:hypothetical protein